MHRVSRQKLNSCFRQNSAAVIAITTISGEVQICIAGHCPIIWVRRGEIRSLDATGLPLGIFRNSSYALTTIEAEPGDSLVLYTDGLTEAQDRSGQEYGTDRIVGLMATVWKLSAQATIDACLNNLADFQAGCSKHDDLTIMVVKRSDVPL
ncbi:MAG TPA: PP2C family protein-serine/threonine phosphatase [Acidobacteriota bacterium]|nr:PP2C family protein-serine/threonine phosphatase [Acidobacteriota bacterium]